MAAAHKGQPVAQRASVGPIIVSQSSSLFFVHCHNSSTALHQVGDFVLSYWAATHLEYVAYMCATYGLAVYQRLSLASATSSVYPKPS